MTYDGCFIFFGDVRYDSRLQNILRSLSKKYSHLILFQISEHDEEFQFDNCKVISTSIPNSLKGIAKFFTFYRKLFPKVYTTKASFYCAEDVFSLPMASLAASQFKSNVFYDSRELYFAIGGLSKSQFKQTIWSNLERYLIRKTNVFSSGEMDSEILKSRYSIPLPTTIYNFPMYRNVVRTNSNQSHSLRSKLKLSEDKIVLIYQGMMSEGRGLYMMLDVLSKLDERFVLVMLGEGTLLESIRHEIKSQNLNGRAFALGRVPYSELLDWTVSADIGLSLIEPISESYRLALPNKLFEYTLCQVPSIVSDLPAMKKTIDEHGIGIAVSLDDSKKISEAIIHVAEHHNEFSTRCKVASKHLNWQVQEKRLLDFFKH